MPIKGVTDKARVERVGKIRLGEMVPGPKGEYPKAVDFFVVKADDATPAEAAASFHAVYGEKPRAIQVLIPNLPLEDVFPQWYKAYGASTGLKCKGDGETANGIDPETGEMVERVCEPDECELYKIKHCRRVASLSIILPDVAGFGVWVVETTSYHSILNLNGALRFLRNIFGDDRLLPAVLCLEPQEVSPDGKKKTVFVMHLRQPHKSLNDLLREAAAAPGRPLALAPLDESKPPDDLYPRSMREPTAAAPAPTAPPPPARELDELDHQIEDGFKTLGVPPAKQDLMRAQYGDDRAGLLKALNCMADGGTEAPAPPTMPDPDELDRNIDEGFKVLGTPAARRRLLREKCGKDRDGLLAAINREIDKRADSLGPGPRTQSRPVSPPGKPAQPPVAASPAKAAAPKTTQPAGPSGPMF